MPPRQFSRHTYTDGFTPNDATEVIECLDGVWPGRSVEFQLDEREPYRFRELPDNRIHRAREGDTLYTLAARLFSNFERPAGLYWIIGDFQPTPVIDPTIRLRPGALIVIPSERVVREDIFAEARRRESNIT